MAWGVKNRLIESRTGKGNGFESVVQGGFVSDRIDADSQTGDYYYWIALEAGYKRLADILTVLAMLPSPDNAEIFVIIGWWPSSGTIQEFGWIADLLQKKRVLVKG